MSDYKFAVEHTGRPYGDMDPAWEYADWYRCNSYTTLRAAERAVERREASMSRYCGPTGWNDHFRIVALRDIKTKVVVRCAGHDGRCPHRASITADAVWHEGETHPRSNDGRIDDLNSDWLCSDCENANYQELEDEDNDLDEESR
jgi:hypothetical protein